MDSGGATIEAAVQEFLQRFAEAVPSSGAGDLSPDTVYREITGWDSLAYLSLLAIIEESYGVILTAHALRTHPTLGELYRYIERNRGDAAPTNP